VSDRITLPVKKFRSDRWAEVCALAPSLTYSIVGERCDLADANFSFIGGHRVRLYKFKKNVHFMVPTGVQIDISNVPSAAAPRRN
jgi:hypothetical protein